MRMAVSVGAASALHIAVAGAVALSGGAIDRDWRTHAVASIEVSALVLRHAAPAGAPTGCTVAAAHPLVAPPSPDRSRRRGPSAPFHPEPARAPATGKPTESASASAPPSGNASPPSGNASPPSVNASPPSVIAGSQGSAALSGSSGVFAARSRSAGGAEGAHGDSPGDRAAAGTRTLQLAELAARIRAHRRYPELARRRGIEGTVVLRFSIRTDGGVAALEVVEGIDPALDEAARDAVLASVPLPPVEGTITVPMPFRLHDPEKR